MKISAMIIFMLLHTSLGLYINLFDQKLSSNNAVKIQKDKWIVLHNILGSKNDKAYKMQYGTYAFLQSYLQINPYDIKSDAQYVKLYLALSKKKKKSKHVRKTGRSISNLKRRRRKVEERMVSSLSPDNFNGVLKVFYHQQDSQKLGYNSSTDDDDDDYREAEGQKNPIISPDYLYENLYDDEEDISLSAKSRKNLEYGSFQDLILQAKYNQLGQKNEELKLQSAASESFG